jgi:hypothetical protein
LDVQFEICNCQFAIKKRIQISNKYPNSIPRQSIIPNNPRFTSHKFHRHAALTALS